jgi:hypothetical protein
MSEANHYRLDGLEPDNLLAFMVLLGLLRALDTARPHWRARVYWDEVRLPLRPVLVLAESQLDSVLTAAAEGVSTLSEAHVFDRKDLNFTIDEARAELESGATPLREALLDALMSDAAVRADGRVWPTPLCFLFGQGHQHFLERLGDVPNGKLPKSLAKLKNPPDLNAPHFLGEALLAPWTRSNPTDSFRWDPAEDRRYALRAINPSSDPSGTQHGANRLAAVALPILSGTVILRRNEPRFINLGTAYGHNGRIRISWPIWRRAARIAGLRALLGHPSLSQDEPEADALAPLGVTAVFRAERLSVGKFFNVTVAEKIM